LSVAPPHRRAHVLPGTSARGLLITVKPGPPAGIHPQADPPSGLHPRVEGGPAPRPFPWRPGRPGQSGH